MRLVMAGTTQLQTTHYEVAVKHDYISCSRLCSAAIWLRLEEIACAFGGKLVVILTPTSTGMSEKQDFKTSTRVLNRRVLQALLDLSEREHSKAL